MHNCYDTGTKSFRNELCLNKEESCGKWTANGKLLVGCILTKYCNIKGSYVGTSDIEFTCPNGVKSSDSGRNTHYFSLDNLMKNGEFHQKFYLTTKTDLVIEATNSDRPGHEWSISGNDCLDLIELESETYSPKTTKKEWLFQTTPNHLHGATCSINFHYKTPSKPDPDSIMDIKKAILYFK